MAEVRSVPINISTCCRPLHLDSSVFYLNIQFIEIELRVWFLKIQVGWNLTVLEAKCYLDNTRQATCSLRMSNIRLD